MALNRGALGSTTTLCPTHGDVPSNTASRATRELKPFFTAAASLLLAELHQSWKLFSSWQTMAGQLWTKFEPRLLLQRHKMPTDVELFYPPVRTMDIYPSDPNPT
jgi:hypothetical protein